LKDFKAEEISMSGQNAEIVSHLEAVARETFGDAQFAAKWLSLPNPALAGSAPLELAESAAGAREVEALLTRIAHGVYS
jgi:putative toxin-antitoxin system antitoxin component (TIGR02293 family)